MITRAQGHSCDYSQLQQWAATLAVTVLQLRLQQTVQVNPGTQCLKFMVWMFVIFKYTSLKTFTSIPITFWGQFSIIKFLVTFWLENFTET